MIYIKEIRGKTQEHRLLIELEVGWIDGLAKDNFSANEGMFLYEFGLAMEIEAMVVVIVFSERF